MIVIHDLTFEYHQDHPIFQGFSWEMEAGESWSIIGPSGCGKSTLLYLLAGLRQPTSGQIKINGELITKPRPQTGLILQDHGLLPWATVEKNAHLGLTIRRFYGPDGRHAPRDQSIDQSEADRRATYWLERLGIATMHDRFPAQLSGGQRQRTAIARTLALQPDLLLMDEPFSALDAYTREDLQNLMVELRQEAPLSSIIVTHNIEEAVLLSNKILVLTEPPNTHSQIIDNPGAGHPDYRRHADYQTVCEELRAIMGVNT